jgi:cellulose synthase/poly-beta-1,6-N-acetylglucosamine synthase-like glycosyltransferase
MYLFSKKKKDTFVETNRPTITVIIPMYNEEKIIQEKIENLARLDYPANKLKIILLDDHSTDDSINISLGTIKQNSLNAQVIESQGGKGKARALNWIIPSLDTEIAVISDADALMKEDSLLWILKNFSDKNIGGVTGKIIPLSDKERSAKSQEDAYRFYYDIWRIGESKIQSVSVCNGPLMSFRTNLLKKIIMLMIRIYFLRS